MSIVNSVGRRKTSVARVYLKTSSGNITINKRVADEFLNHDVLRLKVRQPFATLGLNPDAFDVSVNVMGGGINGQAEAIRLGIARALEKVNPEYRGSLKKAGLLTVDDRQVERKKPGKRKARRSTQFSKR
jgi:small subunit ribosomal protein S9